MNYLLKNFLGSFITIAVMVIVMSVLTNFIPGDPARMALGKHVNKSSYQLMRQEMGLDKPVIKKVVDYVGSLLQGDWGRSYVSRKQVKDIIAEALPVTAKLFLVSLVFALLIGLAVGTLSAYHENAFIDRLLTALSVAGFSLPHFWLALLLQALLGVTLGLLPISGAGEGQFYFYVLPGLAVGIPLGLTYGRFIRYFLLDILSKPFIKAVEGWGLPKFRVFCQHAAPNIVYLLLIQVVTDAAYFFTGAVITETIFSLPGLGNLLVDAVLQRDWPVINGITLITASIITGLNLFVKLIGPVLDPRSAEDLYEGGFGA